MPFHWPWQRREPATPTAPDYLRDNEWAVMGRKTHAAGDINAARTCYQKAAYGFRDMTSEQVDQLRQEVAGFVHDDPVYDAIVNNIRAELVERPGLLQSDIGKLLDPVAEGGNTRELFNYALYFAEVVGDLVRVKSGRSYKLYLPDQAPT